MPDASPNHPADAAPDPELALGAARQAILDALAQVASTKRYESPMLHDVVARYARAAREAGRPPEWLVIDLKQLMAMEALPDLRDWFRGVLRDRLVSWGISEYFRLPPTS